MCETSTHTRSRRAALDERSVGRGTRRGPDLAGYRGNLWGGGGRFLEGVVKETDVRVCVCECVCVCAFGCFSQVANVEGFFLVSLIDSLFQLINSLSRFIERRLSKEM